MSRKGNNSELWLLKKRKGSQHPNWNPNIPLEDKINKRGIVKNVQYETWRKQVFERDNYTCKFSHKKGKIVAHHIESWNSNPDLRYAVENGITMLENLHILFHKLYGKGNNTASQLKEFSEMYEYK